jgi:hypothetical protein
LRAALAEDSAWAMVWREEEEEEEEVVVVARNATRETD